MPKRTHATLRDLRAVELQAQHLADRDKAHGNFRSHVEMALRNGNGNGHAALVNQLHQALFELDTGLRVALRMHELRLQELQTIEKFPDES